MRFRRRRFRKGGFKVRSRSRFGRGRVNRRRGRAGRRSGARRMIIGQRM